MSKAFHAFAVQNRLSVWLSFCTLIVAATMMHPTGASLIAIFFVALGIFAVRTVAHIEGRTGGDG